MGKKVASFWQKFKQLDVFLDIQVPFLLLLLLLVVIRLPSLFEPFWYGDEGIYLAVGNAIRHGAKLYTEVFDHKTPIIYYLAALSGGQMWLWKLFGLFASMLSLFMFDQIAKFFIGRKGWKSKLLVWVTDLIFLLVFNLPPLEGNVVNAEIFFVAFDLTGAFFWLLSGALDNFKLGRNQLSSGEVDPELKKNSKRVADNLIAQKPKTAAATKKKTAVSAFVWTKAHKKQAFWAGLGGFFFALGFLTKFHGLFDLYAWAIPLAFLSLTVLNTKKPVIIGLVAGFLVPLIATLIFFLIQGTLADFWQAAFAYSFQYSSYSHISDNSLLEWLFSTKGKMILLLLTTGALWWQYRKLDLGVIVTSLWLVAALVGASLSNRNYAHYFLQFIPPLVMAVPVMVAQIIRLWQVTFKEKQWPSLALNLAFPLLAIAIAYGSFYVLKVEPFFKWRENQESIVGYYKNFYRFITDQQNVYGMYGYFDSQLRDNYAVADYIRNDQNPYLFIWGNNPDLYAQTDKLSVTPYLTNYHLYDYGDTFDEEEPLALEVKGLVEHQPTFAVTMKEIDGYGQEIIDQIAIEAYLEDHYEPLLENNSFILWQRTN